MPSIRFAARPGRGLRTVAAGPVMIGGQHDDAITSWRDAGHCRKEDPEMFFPHKKTPRALIDEAKEVCEFCPVKRECLQWALDADENYGIWGGLTAHERQIRKNPGVGRRKNLRDLAPQILAEGKQPCSRCKEVKTLDRFPVYSQSPIGRGGTCKQCKSDLARRTRTLRQEGVDPVPRVEYPARLRRDAARANAA